MRAVILAAGEGKRMLPLTLTVPKPLLRIKNKTVLDYVFDAFPEEVDQVIIVVGYLKKKIQQHLGSKYRGRPIRYVVQNILDGSATALLSCGDLFLPGERFMVVYADDMPAGQEMADCLRHQYSWLCTPTDDPRQSGIATFSKDGCISGVIEKPENPSSDISVAGTMVINSDIFSYKPTKHIVSGEYYLTSLMDQFILSHKVKAVFGKKRPNFLSPDEIEKLNADFL